MTEQAGKAGADASAARGARKLVTGTVVSDKMAKTIVVEQSRLTKHARYGKYQRRVSSYKAHDEEGLAHVGDEVEIAETRRLSKTKNWRLVRVIRKGKVEAVRGEEDRERVAVRPVTRPPVPAAPKAPEVSS
jgi:small subunit ribosomal protein S17